MKKLFILMLGAFLLTSCDSSVQDSQSATDRLTYFKDARTGLCFGQVISTGYGGFTSTSITCVPCDSVKALLK